MKQRRIEKELNTATVCQCIHFRICFAFNMPTYFQRKNMHMNWCLNNENMLENKKKRIVFTVVHFKYVAYTSKWPPTLSFYSSGYKYVNSEYKLIHFMLHSFGSFCGHACVCVSGSSLHRERECIFNLMAMWIGTEHTSNWKVFSRFSE